MKSTQIVNNKFYFLKNMQSQYKLCNEPSFQKLANVKKTQTNVEMSDRICFELTNKLITTWVFFYLPWRYVFLKSKQAKLSFALSK